MFYRTNQHDDCKDNFSKLLSSVNSVLAGNKAEYKWIIICLFMFLQSLFIIALSHSNKYPIIKKEHHSKTKNNRKYTFKIGFPSNGTIDEPFTIKNENGSIIILVLPSFGSEESFHGLTEALINQNINITEKQIKTSFRQAETLLPINELFKKIKKIVTIDREIAQSFKVLIELRNDFIHFPPKRWSIEINSIKTIVLHCSQLSLLLIRSVYVREYELDKNEMIKGLNKIIKDLG